MKKMLLFLFSLFFIAIINAQRPIITKWNVPLTPNTIDIKIRSDGSFMYQYVNANNPAIYGQGNGGSTVNTTITTISLPEAGEYIVSIFPSSSFKFNFDSSNFATIDKNKFILISQWGDVNWKTDLSGMFNGCSNLKITATDVPDFSNVTNMSGMFTGCRALTTVPNMNNWNLSNVINIRGMFVGARNFNEDIGNWDTSKITDMSNVFFGAEQFNQNIGDWDTSQVTNMTGMFRGASLFNQNIGNWNTSKVIYMTAMFEDATLFNQNIGNWDTTKVTTMSYMFNNAINFNQNIGNWVVNLVGDMRNMFDGATGFNQNLQHWKLSSNVRLENMFNNSGIDCENYSRILYGWVQNISSPTYRKLGALGMKYGISAKVYRDKLIQLKGWTITGDALESNCNIQLATSEIEKENFLVFPNPTKGIFNIYSKTKEEIFIYNFAGQMLRKETLKAGDNKIDISTFPNGVYILQKENKTYKLIKE